MPVVSLLTCTPGSEIYELEGHTALRFQHSDTGQDYVVNWGLFDFDSPNFVYRFVKGETDYCSGLQYTQRFLYPYMMQGRSVYEQTLALTPEQALRLEALVQDCVQPENRTYRYNYVLDNCATRALHYVELACGDTIALGGGNVGFRQPTFRQLMMHFHRNYPWYQFGINLALGQGLDRKIEPRKLTFAPVLLMEKMADATTLQGAPMVKAHGWLVDNTGIEVMASPTPWPLTPMAVAVYILTAAVIITIRDMRRHRLSRWFDTGFYAVTGLAGCVIAFLVFVSVHEATSPNWVILWLNPLALLPAILVWIKSARQLLIWWQIINFVALIVLVAIFVSGKQQPDAAFYPLIAADALRSLAQVVILWSKPQNH